MKSYCPICGVKYQIEEDQIGMMFECAQCQHKFKAVPPEIPVPVSYSAEEEHPNLCTCPDCGKMISRRARWCPFCGCYDTASETKKGYETSVFIKRINIPLMDAVILIITFGFASAVILVVLAALASIVLGHNFRFLR